MPKSNHMRNDPTGTFDAHLFDREAVEAAGGGKDDEQTDKPVSSKCNRTTSYGPFFSVSQDDAASNLPDRDGGLCSVCAQSLEDDGGESA